MSLENGLLNLSSWLGNVIMPTLAGLCFAGAIYHYSKGRPHQNFLYGGFAALLCSGFTRALESFSQQAGWNDPDRYWLGILALTNWVGNVLLPLYGVLQVIAAVTHYAGLLERANIGQPWVRNVVSALMCFGLSGLLRLAEFFVQNGTAGVR